MTRLGDGGRRLRDLPGDVSGQLLTEWVLLTATIILPLAATYPVLLGMLKTYFYRIAGTISLPFP